HYLAGRIVEISLPQGIYHNRFRLVFQEKTTEALIVEDKLPEKFDIFQNNKNAQLEIRNPALIPILSVAIFDLSGKQVFYQDQLENKEFFSISTEHLINSIYIVKILKEDQVKISKKITILDP
ncbi:MAG TPA: T9SS type A sorting domain-containing protein, partial [Salinimicrobium sp.]|nr:T9SS type A sorting domain-containing protein [Salinimicrobium sp.]